MTETYVKVPNKIGLHADYAIKFVNLANKFTSEISVYKGEKKVNGKSLLGILSVAIMQNDTIKIAAKGVDENQAVTKLSAFIKNFRDRNS